MKIVTIDASKLREKNESHKYLKEAFGFPDYYGNNLDALNDCLGDIRDLKIFITNINAAGPYFLSVYPVLMRCAKTMTIG